MKSIFIITIMSLFTLITPPKNRVIFFGDSITQMGVNPGGYIDLIKKQLILNNKSTNYELIGKGVGGNKIYDLYLRVPEDVLDLKPQTVVVYIGINDVWHKTSGTGTDKDKFEKFYRALVSLFQKNNIRVILCTPTLIGEKLNNENPQDADLNEYAEVVRLLAKEKKCELVDLRELCVDYLKLYNQKNADKGVLTTDRVHLNDAGNLLVAKALLKII